MEKENRQRPEGYSIAQRARLYLFGRCHMREQASQQIFSQIVPECLLLEAVAEGFVGCGFGAVGQLRLLGSRR